LLHDFVAHGACGQNEGHNRSTCFRSYATRFGAMWGDSRA